jgi:predicted regulator of amino acid metabolism with ACT domain
MFLFGLIVSFFVGVVTFIIIIGISKTIGFWASVLFFLSMHGLYLAYLQSQDPSGSAYGWIVIYFQFPAAMIGLVGIGVGGVMILNKDTEDENK